MQFLDPSLIGELSATVLGVTQWLKNKPALRSVDGELIAIGSGAAVGVVWFVARGDIIQSPSLGGVRWDEAFIAAMNGVLGGVAASTGFNIQKLLPIPNVLPTRTEKEQQAQAATNAAGGVSAAATVTHQPPAAPPPAAAPASPKPIATAVIEKPAQG